MTVDQGTVAHPVATTVGIQPQMGNSRPGRRLEEEFSQAGIAPIGNREHEQRRTFKPASQDSDPMC